ncbi:putative polysaccharide deacetylase [Fictibacillus macauensis ZFHKF-1]|uniref:Putative polysaccharide deacetylase n=1 Tax=Fictibacillus macauensis ZFHKF-1 TaxID=1196324 RepID=I8UFL0_9BACL|nr:polysaccharide deacetylase family protein [Fictibacillus macauensis]EIT85598.1 putative polysaccharide deacetylase [Fictibacillus macauensis ZFHKF-1]
MRGQRRKKAGKREAIIVLLLSIVGIAIIYGSWHVNKITAIEKKKEKSESKNDSSSDSVAKKEKKAHDHDKKPANVDHRIKASKKPLPATKKVVYLSFDDGPSPYSNQIMDTLKKYNASATFFMLSPNILSHKEAVKRMDKEGFNYGLHGVSHDAKLIYRTKDTVVKEMDQDNDTLYKVTGKKTNMIRTPYGSAPYMKPPYQKAVKDHGYHLWDWTIDSRDWAFRSPAYVPYTINQFNALKNTHEPLIILMHEKKTTLDSLPRLLAYIQSQGYKMKRLEMNMKPYKFKVH